MPSYLMCGPNICVNNGAITWNKGHTRANLNPWNNNSSTHIPGLNPLALCQEAGVSGRCCGSDGNFDAFGTTDNYNSLVSIWQIAMVQYTGAEPNALSSVPGMYAGGLPHCVDKGGCIGVPSQYSNLIPIGQVLMPTDYNLQICDRNDPSRLSVNGDYLQCLNECDLHQCPVFGSNYQYDSCSSGYTICNYIKTCKKTPTCNCYSSSSQSILTQWTNVSYSQCKNLCGNSHYGFLHLNYCSNQVKGGVNNVNNEGFCACFGSSYTNQELYLDADGNSGRSGSTLLNCRARCPINYSWYSWYFSNS